MSKLPTMAHVWMRMAEMIYNRETDYLCRAVKRLRKEGQISRYQFRSVQRAIDSEVKRRGLKLDYFLFDGGRPPLWPGGCDAERIRFCAEQIRRLGRRGR